MSSILKIFLLFYNIKQLRGIEDEGYLRKRVGREKERRDGFYEGRII